MTTRRAKPSGYEKWTWAEIDAGRRMSKGEKRMRRAVQAYQGAPLRDRIWMTPFIFMVFGVAVAGLGGGASAIGALIFIISLLVSGALYVVVRIFEVLSRITPVRVSMSRPRLGPIVRPMLGCLCSASIRGLGAIARGFIIMVKFGWIKSLPEWGQPIVWGLLISVPMGLVIAMLFSSSR
jgi:hypothetical protein